MTVPKLSQLIGECLKYLDLHGITRLHQSMKLHLNKPTFNLCLMDFDSILEYAPSDERIFPLDDDKRNMIFNRMGREFLIHRSEEVNPGTVEVSFVVPFDMEYKRGVG